MQRLILPPSLPSVPGIEFAASYQTSRHAGGDYYDVLTLGPGRFGLMVADVSGHGAPAAIVMAMIRAALHSHPDSHGDPAAVLQMLNVHFEYLWDSAMFSTAIYAVVDTERRELHCACAGHPLPLLVREGAAVSPLTVDAVPPLLLMPLDHIPTTRVTLAQGDRVVFYTDGITERLDGQEHMYELERLVGLLDRSGGVPATALVERVIADVSAFAAGHESEDDQTVVVVGFP